MVTTISSFCFASLSSFFILIAIFGSTNAGKYLPNWDSIDQRPLPAWYDESKIGIFIHWGVFSVPSYGSEWFWRNWHDGQSGYVEFMKKNYRPDFTYADFARDFTCEFFNATQWVDTFKASGAKYVCFFLLRRLNLFSNGSITWSSLIRLDIVTFISPEQRPFV